MFTVVREIHDTFNIESTWAFALLVAVAFGLAGGIVGYMVDRAYKRAEERRLIEATSPTDDRYVVGPGRITFRIETLDQDLKKVGLSFDGLSTPQAKPTPQADAIPQEYFLLKDGLYLRAQWRNGTPMSADDRERAERVILAHEARLKVQ